MDFLSIYQQKMLYPDFPNFYELAMTSFESSNSIQQKKEILLKTLFFYPKSAELYYKMACLHANTIECITWHKLCYEFDPQHKNNIIDVIQLLYYNGLSPRVFDFIDKTAPVFSELMENPQFLFIYSRCNFQKLYYKDGVDILLKLIKYYGKKPAITEKEKIDKWSNYHDLGYVYCAMGEIELSLKYTKKAVELSKKFNLDMPSKLLSFSNSLCYSEFKYGPYEDHTKINEYLPDRPMFSFATRGKKTRIGYVSSDFMYHAVANFIIPILENHDKSRFEIVLYANQTEFTTDIFVNLNLPYVLIRNMSDKEAAAKINADKIDILVDLNGHTIGNRLGVFSFHPAPIQITYLGYPNTTGLKAIKYRITDGYADSITTQQKYSENLVRLYRCFLLYKPFNKDLPVKPKITEKTVILAAINKENKNSPETLETWAKILESCPNTKLLIKLESFDNNEDRMAFYLERLRTSADRIIIINKLNNTEYTQLFSKIDILLDPFPYSGTTTTCNALYNSIPVVTLYNDDRHAHNVSSSILIYSGLMELVCKTREHYIEVVEKLVNDPERINGYKKTIGEKFKAGIMNTSGFMSVYETALLELR